MSLRSLGPRAFSQPLAWLMLGLASTAAQAGGTLTFCQGDAPEGFDMAQYQGQGTINAVGVPLYEQLTRIRSEDARVVPGLAESWQLSPDGRVYTMKLRPGVKFHTTPWFKPTRDMNADDVLWSFRRMVDKAHPGHAAAHNGFPYWSGMGMNELVRAIDKVDAMTVRFTLARPDAPFLATLGVTGVGPILSAEYAEKLRAAGRLAQLNVEPVGTGPFVLKSYQKDAVIRYTPHRDHWGGAPKIDAMVYAITPDPDVVAQRLKAAECLVGAVTAESLAALAGNDSLQVLSSRPLTTFYVGVHHRHPYTSDRRFREALWQAIDKAALIRGGFGGRATAAAGFLPATMWGLNTTLKERHDPARARQGVKASGYDGRELLFFTGNDPLTRRRAEFLQADWAQIGVKVVLRTMDLGELIKRTSRGEHDLMLMSWTSDNGDPDNFFTPNLSCAAVGGGGTSHWCHPAFDQLLDRARATPDVAQRTGFYKQAQRLLYDEVGLIPLVYPELNTVVNKRVAGFTPSPLDVQDFRGVTVK